jgi:hypothetical protein
VCEDLPYRGRIVPRGDQPPPAPAMRARQHMELQGRPGEESATAGRRHRPRLAAHAVAISPPSVAARWDVPNVSGRRSMPTTVRAQGRHASAPSTLVAATPAGPTRGRPCGRRRSLCHPTVRGAVSAEWSGSPWFATHGPPHDPRVGSSWPLYFWLPWGEPEISCRASPPYFLRRVRGWLHPLRQGLGRGPRRHGTPSR